jgi:hypothetical protein
MGCQRPAVKVRSQAFTKCGRAAAFNSSVAQPAVRRMWQ